MLIGFEWPARQVATGHLLELAEGLAPILGVLDVRDFPAVDLQMSLAPRSDIDLKLVASHGCEELLHGGALAYGKLLVGFPIDLLEVMSAALNSGMSMRAHKAISGTWSGIVSSASVAATTWSTDTPGPVSSNVARPRGTQSPPVR